MIGVGLSIPDVIVRRGGANQAPPGSPIPVNSPVIEASNNGVHPCTFTVKSVTTWTNNPTSKSYQWVKDGAAFGSATVTPQPLDSNGPGNYRLTETATNAFGSNFKNSNTITATMPATAPSFTQSPKITGTAKEGQKVTVDRGTVSGTQPITYEYAWYFNNTLVPDNTTNEFNITSQHIGGSLYCIVKAINSADNITSQSNTIGPVAQLERAPTVKREPVITGTATQGQTLTVDDGEYDGFPIPSITRQWYRNTAAINGQIEKDYILTVNDVNREITCKVTATNSVDTITATSNKIGPIASSNTAPARMAAPMVTPGVKTISVDRADNTNNGGSAITAYALRYSTDEMNWTQVNMTNDPQSINGLLDTQDYYIQTRASNAVGHGEWSLSATTKTLTPATVPAKMVKPVLVAGDKQISMTIAGGTADGGSAITSYEWRLSSDGGATFSNPARITNQPTVFSGLTNGTAYQVQTRANNAVGAGPWSDSETATPKAEVVAPKVFRDDFNRANNTDIVDDPNWTRTGNVAGLGIVNNQLVTYAREAGYMSPDLGSDDQYTQHLIVGGSTVGPFIVNRLVDENNWGSACRYNVQTGAGQVWKRQGGTLTQYGSTTGSPCVVGATLRLETVDDQTQLVVNGAVFAGPWTMNGAGQGVTRQGYVSRNNANSPWADNYEAGVITALTT